MSDPKIPGGYYIKARAIQKSNIMRQPPHVREIWDYLLMNANHSHRKYGGYLVKRGQLFRTYKQIREDLSWNVGWRKETYNENQTKKAMKFLREALMIETTKEPGGVLITICNYEFYQDPRNYERTNERTDEITIDEPSTNQPVPYNNNVNNKRKETTTTIVDSETESTSFSHNGDQNDTKNRGNDAAPGNGFQNQNDEPPIVQGPPCEGTNSDRVSEDGQSDRDDMDGTINSKTANGLPGSGKQEVKKENSGDEKNREIHIQLSDSPTDGVIGSGRGNCGDNGKSEGDSGGDRKPAITKSFTIQNAREMRLPWWSEQEWEDLIDLRRKKKTAQTKRAYNQLIKEFELARKKGYTAEEIINAMSFGKGWAGFKLEWMKDPPEKKNGNAKILITEDQKRSMRKAECDSCEVMKYEGKCKNINILLGQKCKARFPLPEYLQVDIYDAKKADLQKMSPRQRYMYELGMAYKAIDNGEDIFNGSRC